jgi:hypothetical protein
MKAKTIRFNNPRRNRPFAIFFVYAKKGNYILKGCSDEIRAYIKENLFESVYNYTFWKNGEHRGGWSSECLSIHRCTKEGKLAGFRADKSLKEKKWRIAPRIQCFSHKKLAYTEIPCKILKRIPHKWIPEYDRLLEWSSCQTS